MTPWCIVLACSWRRLLRDVEGVVSGDLGNAPGRPRNHDCRSTILLAGKKHEHGHKMARIPRSQRQFDRRLGEVAKAVGMLSRNQGCIRREGTSEAAPEAV